VGQTRRPAEEGEVKKQSRRFAAGGGKELMTGRALLFQEVAEWRSNWDSASKRHPAYVPCLYCKPERSFGKLAEHIRAEHGKTSADFRRDHGLNKNCPLASKNFRDLMRSKNGKRLRRAGKATRFRMGQLAGNAVKARVDFGVSPQEQANRMRASRKLQPNLRKRDDAGRAVPYWAVVEPRLRGLEAKRIAVDVRNSFGISITPSAIVARWRTLRLPPGKPCVFHRGEAVCDKQLLDHWSDIQFVRGGKLLRSKINLSANGNAQLGVAGIANLLQIGERSVREMCRPARQYPIPHEKCRGRLVFKPDEVAEWVAQMRHGKAGFRPRATALAEMARSLRIGVHRVREFVVQDGGPQDRRNARKRRVVGHPLSWDLASRLVQVAEPALKKELRTVAATARGGNPEVLLPSEKKVIPREYDELTADCRNMLEWASRQESVTMETLGEWMCGANAAGRIRRILFWLSLHRRLLAMCTARAKTGRGEAPLAEQSKSLLASEHGCSVDTIERVISAHRRKTAA
jgi:hypothetical protein